MARVEIPVSGWTCLRTRTSQYAYSRVQCKPTFVDVGRISLLSGLATLLLLARGGSRSLLSSLLLLSRSLASWGLTTSAGLLLSGLWGHFGKWLFRWECGSVKQSVNEKVQIQMFKRIDVEEDVRWDEKEERNEGYAVTREARYLYQLAKKPGDPLGAKEAEFQYGNNMYDLYD